MTHLSITQSSVMALITQLASFVAGFGVLNSVQEGVIISVATAAVNAAFLIANALHHNAAARENSPLVSVAPADPPVTFANPPVT